MAYGAPADPVAGTVITVAYAVSNILDPLRWLRLLTGNADPPGSNYVVVSDSTTGTTWRKVPSDALATGAVVSHLGYVPANAAGQAFSGSISVVGDVSATGNLGGATLSATGQVTAGQYAGGTTAAGSPQVKGLTVGTDGIVTTGTVSPAAYVGGSTATGTPSVLGLNVGTSGIASAGVVTPAAYAGGTTGSGSPSVKGLTVGVDGIASTGTMRIAGQEVYWSGNPPPASAGGQIVGELRPIGAASLTPAHAAGWLTCDGSAVSRTTHAALFLAIGTAFGIGDGSTTFNVPDLRGRFPMGASGSHAQGSSGGAETFNAQHNHSGSPMTVSGTAAASGSTLNGRFTAGGANALPDNHTHAVTGTVGGNTADSGSTTQSVLNPYQAVNFIIYSGVAT